MKLNELPANTHFWAILDGESLGVFVIDEFGKCYGTAYECRIESEDLEIISVIDPPADIKLPFFNEHKAPTE